MKKTYLIPVFLILLIILLYLSFQNRELLIKIKKQDQEILASTNYIEKINSRLQEFKKYNYEISKEEKLKRLLDDYLSQLDEVNESLIADTQDIKVDLQQLERKEWFIPNKLPVGGQYYISQTFSAQHKGLDFAAPLGTEVLAAGAGVINYIGEDKYFGIMIEIDHLNGYTTRYTHLAKVLIHSNDLIKKGTVIALVGDTGNSTAPHLHFEILKDKENLDPEKFLNIFNK